MAMGCDFDGTDLPEGLTGIESVPTLAEVFLRHGYPQQLVEAIFFNNAYVFFAKTLTEALEYTKINLGILPFGGCRSQKGL